MKENFKKEEIKENARKRQKKCTFGEKRDKPGKINMKMCTTKKYHSMNRGENIQVPKGSE
jgi:hypothetical protein